MASIFCPRGCGLRFGFAPAGFLHGDGGVIGGLAIGQVLLQLIEVILRGFESQIVLAGGDGGKQRILADVEIGQL